MQPDSTDPADDIDRKSLRALRDRFLALNRDRVEALRNGFSDERRTFFDAIPVLMHSNHAALPGFVDFDVPCGIERYTPDRRALNAVRKVALSFVLERFVERRTQIQALYVTQLPDNALELSVISAVATHAALNEKLTRLVRYAADRGIALTTTLLDPVEEQARRSRLRNPCLSRDTFYRSAILLAGRYPIWWLVPPRLDHAHDEYCARLKSQRFIGRDDTFDLGRAEPIPRAECLTAGVDLMEAALETPYVQLPSLMLLESYACDATLEPLAHAYKERIWNGDEGIDWSTLMDEAIAAYLADAPERLALARDCRRGAPREPSLAELQRENARVNGELQRTHEHLTRLASELNAPAEMHNRLRAAGERISRWTENRNDTIPRINPALWPRRVAGRVRVEARAEQWQLRDEERTAFAATRFAATIAWAHAHRLGTDNLRVDDARRHACARTLELLSQLDRTSAGPSATPSTMLIVNAEESPQFALRPAGEAIVSDWDDPLNFSGFHISLIAGVDVLQIGDDGIVASGNTGDDGLITSLTGLLAHPPDTLRVHCVGGEYDRAIEERIGELVAQMSDAFRHDSVGRFVFALAGGFVIVERSAGRFSSRRCSDAAQLFEALAAPSRAGLRTDARNIRLDALSCLCGIATSASDTVLVHDQRGSVTVLLALRDGAIHRFFAPSQQKAHEVSSRLDEVVTQAGLRGVEIYTASASDAPHLVSRRPKRTDGRVAPRRNLLTLLREQFAVDADIEGRDRQTMRHPTIA